MSKKVFYILLLCLSVAVIWVAQMLFSQQALKNHKTAKSLSHPALIRLQKNDCPAAKGEVNIVFITDRRYVTPTRVAMSSAIKTKCANSVYNFYVITENISPSDEQALLRLKSLSPETVNITLIPKKEPDLPYENMQRFLQYKVGMHKIYLPETLPNLDKVIYMDGDTLVLKDLRKLFDMDVAGIYALAAKDGIYYRFPKEMAELGLTKRGFYFNSGVMLYNLDLQRKEGVVAKLIDYVKNNEDFFGDQDVLNIVFGDKVKLMPYRYNCISTFFEEDDLNFLSTYFNEPLPKETFYIYENASILHYAGDKPWQENYKPVFLKELWYRFYEEIRDY